MFVFLCTRSRIRHKFFCKQFSFCLELENRNRKQSGDSEVAEHPFINRLCRLSDLIFGERKLKSCHERGASQGRVVFINICGLEHVNIEIFVQIINYLGRARHIYTTMDIQILRRPNVYYRLFIYICGTLYV